MNFNTELFRKGPGLLVRDIMRGEDDQVRAVVTQIARLAPDVVALQGIDYDYDGVALSLLQQALEEQGHAMPYRFIARPNTGLRTGLDLDQNGRLAEARDAQGYGTFAGQGGMAVLSRYPVDEGGVRNFTDLLWSEAPQSRIPTGYFPPEARDILRLHAVAAWDIPVILPQGTLRVLTSHAGPPVFDGPENRNGLRNHDEIMFWATYIADLPTQHFALLADLNSDPFDGESMKPAIEAILNHPRLTDPVQTSAGGVQAADPGHRGPPGHDTVLWQMAQGPGNLRVDYAMASRWFEIAGSGIDWPAVEPEGGFGSRHRPVWVDIVWD